MGAQLSGEANPDVCQGWSKDLARKILLEVLSRKVHIGTFQNREDGFAVPKMFFLPSGGTFRGG